MGMLVYCPLSVLCVCERAVGMGVGGHRERGGGLESIRGDRQYSGGIFVKQAGLGPPANYVCCFRKKL